MSLKVVEIIFNDNPSKYNKDLTDFLKRNISSIVLKARLRVKFVIAKINEIPKLRDRGIKKLPAMLVNGKIIVGVSEIIDFFRKQINESKYTAPPKSEEEILADYYKNTMGNYKKGLDGKIVFNDNDESDEDNDLSKKLNKELEKRKGKTGAKTGLPSKPSKNTEFDNDYDESMDMSTNRSRSNNINEDDTFAAFDRIKGKNGNDSRDDDMMRQMLEKIG